MTSFPYTIRSKFGLTATLIAGAVVGDRLRRHQQDVHQSQEHETGFCSEKGNDAREDKHNKIISGVHRSLQALSATDNSSTVTGLCSEFGKASCERYLASHGQQTCSCDWWLANWITAADDCMDAGELWVPLPALHTFQPTSFSGTLLAGMKALWYLSKGLSFKNAHLSSDLAETLSEAVKENNTLITPLALKVIANAAVHPENHKTLHEAGATEVLTECAENRESRVFLPAWRALHNYHSGTGADPHGSDPRIVYLEGVYPYVMPGDSKGAEADIILVHGVRGGAEWTFRQHDSVRNTRTPLPQDMRRAIVEGAKATGSVDDYYSWCWPLDWLVPDLPRPVRVLATSYEAQWRLSRDESSTHDRSIASHSQDLYDALKSAGVGQRPIIWLTHSMGGLLVKHMMTACDGALGKASIAVVFLSVPHHGSPLATAATNRLFTLLLRPTHQVQEMRIDNPELAALHKSFLHLVSEHNIAVLTLNETQPTLHKPTGYDFHFVPSKFGDPGVGEFYEVNTTHLDICKPLNRNCEVYQRIMNFLQDVTHKL